MGSTSSKLEQMAKAGGALAMLVASVTLLSCISCFHPAGDIGFRANHKAGYSIDASFTAEERHDIRDGVAAWEKAANGHLVMIEEEPRWSLIHFRKYTMGELGFAPNGNVLVGLCHTETGVIDIVPTKRLRATAIHELGHMWGLKHNEDVESFMREDIGTVVLPDGDIKSVDYKPACRVLGC
jgi:hypothetical protein